MTQHTCEQSKTDTKTRKPETKQPSREFDVDFSEFMKPSDEEIRRQLEFRENPSGE